MYTQALIMLGKNVVYENLLYIVTKSKHLCKKAIQLNKIFLFICCFVHSIYIYIPHSNNSFMYLRRAVKYVKRRKEDVCSIQTGYCFSSESNLLNHLAMIPCSQEARHFQAIKLNRSLTK